MKSSDIRAKSADFWQELTYHYIERLQQGYKFKGKVVNGEAISKLYIVVLTRMTVKHSWANGYNPAII